MKVPPVELYTHRDGAISPWEVSSSLFGKTMIVLKYFATKDLGTKILTEMGLQRRGTISVRITAVDVGNSEWYGYFTPQKGYYRSSRLYVKITPHNADAGSYCVEVAPQAWLMQPQQKE